VAVDAVGGGGNTVVTLQLLCVFPHVISGKC